MVEGIFIVADSSNQISQQNLDYFTIVIFNATYNCNKGLELRTLLSVLGECITSVGDMCALNSIAEECAVNSTAATKCSCIDGYQQVVGNDLTCIGK